MSMESQIDYAAVLEDLENDRAELEALIAYIKRKKLGQGMDIQITPGTGSMKSTGMRPTMMRGTTIAQDAFFSLGLIDAAKKYLAIMKAPKSAREIADALRAGGFNTTSKDFNNTFLEVSVGDGPRGRTYVDSLENRIDHLDNVDFSGIYQYGRCSPGCL